MKAIQRLTGCLLAVGLLAAPGCAATVGYGTQASYRGVDRADDAERRAYDQGYKEGLAHGRDDARHRLTFDFRRHDDFRDADQGYRRHRDGDIEEYRESFRRGFIAGYDEAYRANTRDRDDREDRDDHGHHWWR